jgi:Kdo2-lipid IVA lauroyltransferase/acyltransferase
MSQLSGKIAHLSTWFGFKIGCGVAKVSPRTLYWIADRLAAIGYRCFRDFRHRSVANLRIALGDRVSAVVIDAMAQRSLRNFFRSCVELLIAIESSDDEMRKQITLVGRENLDAALAKGNGVLVLSAHLGNFFLVGSRLAVEGYATSVLVNQPRDGSFAKLVDAYRLKIRQQTIHARPRRAALRELSGILRKNQLAIVIVDEFRNGSGVEVPFFGGTVISRRGPATLALRTGAAIVPVYLIRQPDDGLKLIVEPELELDRSAKGSTEVQENTARVARWLERTVRDNPDLWNWMNIRYWVENHKLLAGEKKQLRQAV